MTSVVLDVTWTVDGTGVINHSLNPISGGAAVPDWVVLTESLAMLTINAPKVDQDVTYQFEVQSHVPHDSRTYNAIITLIVTACPVSGWGVWGASGSGICLQWDNGYTLQSGKCYEDGLADNAIVGSQIAIGVTVVATLTASILTMSSFQSVWTIFNQIQLLMLLPLTKVYISPKVVDYLVGMSFVNLDFNFIPFENIPFVDFITSNIDYDSNNGYVERIGLESKNSFVNQISLFFVFLIVFIVHSKISMFCRLLNVNEKDKCIHKTLKKLYSFMTFGVYITLIAEGFQIIMLGSLNEVNLAVFSDSLHIFSYCWSWIILLIWALFLILWVIEWLRSRNPRVYVEQIYFTIIFERIRQHWPSRGYMLFNYLRRGCLVGWVILSPIEKHGTISIFVTVQFLYSAYVIVLRPFQEVKDNIIELMNETIFFTLGANLIYFNSKENWSELVENIFLYTIMGNNSMISLIMISNQLLTV
jgi:hypothetical protein